MSLKKIPIESQLDTTKKNELVTMKEFPNFMREFISMVSAMGTFLKTMGNIEKRNPALLENMKNFSSPENLELFVEKAPPEILGLLFKTMIRFTKLSQIKDVMLLSPDEKIQVGEEMEKVSQDLSDLLKKIEVKTDGDY